MAEPFYQQATDSGWARARARKASGSSDWPVAGAGQQHTAHSQQSARNKSCSGLSPLRMPLQARAVVIIMVIIIVMSAITSPHFVHSELTRIINTSEHCS